MSNYSEQFKDTMIGHNRTVVDAWVNRDGFATVIVRDARESIAIARDLISSGLKKVRVERPDPSNPYCDGNYRVRGAVL
jgi:hypothetical protein